MGAGYGVPCGPRQAPRPGGPDKFLSFKKGDGTGILRRKMNDSHLPPQGSMRQMMHDLNGQLFVVRGNAELIEMTTTDAAARDKAAKLIEACDKLADIAQKLHNEVRDKNL